MGTPWSAPGWMNGGEARFPVEAFGDAGGTPEAAGTIVVVVLNASDG
jgi:hypothetical protein